MGDSSKDGEKQGPSKFKLLLFGPLTIALGVGLFLFFYGDTTLECDRTQNECTIQKNTIVDGDETTVSLDEVHGTEIKEGTKRGKTYCTVYLEADQGYANLTHADTRDQSNCQAIADEVDSFLDDPDQQHLETTDDGGIFFPYWPPALVLIGMLMLLAGIKR